MFGCCMTLLYLTGVQGGPGVDGQGQHRVEVVMIVTSGGEHLQSPQGAAQARLSVPAHANTSL